MSKPFRHSRERGNPNYCRSVLDARRRGHDDRNCYKLIPVLMVFLLVLLTAGPGWAATEGPGEVWYGLYQGDNKIGWHHEQVVADGVLWRQTSHTELNLAMGGMSFRTTMDGDLSYDTAYRPREFGYRVQGDMINLAVTGRAVGDTLIVKIVSGGSTQEMQFSIDQLTLPQLADLAMRGRELKVGDSFSFRVFEPTALKDGELIIHVDREAHMLVGATMRRVMVLKIDFAGLATETWLDSEGVPLLITAPMGLVFRRESQELATVATTGEPLDLMTRAAITPARPIARPRELFAARYRLTGASLDGLALDGAGQKFADGVVQIGRPHVLSEWTGMDVQRDRVPLPDAMCDYDQPAVSVLAMKLRDETVLPARGNPAGFWQYYARSNLRWINDNITPRLTLSLPRASQVLAMRQGDCNEMAVLLCALLRAQGYPAQVVAGVVYVDGKFYYHAWVETADHAIDPAFNQESADATHIKLVEGDLLAQARILNIIGQLQIEPLPEQSR